MSYLQELVAHCADSSLCESALRILLATLLQPDTGFGVAYYIVPWGLALLGPTVWLPRLLKPAVYLSIPLGIFPVRNAAFPGDSMLYRSHGIQATGNLREFCLGSLIFHHHHQDSNLQPLKPKFSVFHHHHQSLYREGRWSTTDDFASSFLHFSLFSTAL